MPYQTLGKPFEILQVGVDYATFTAKVGSRASEAYARAKYILDQENESGNTAKPWKGFSYLGWTSSHITLGKRSDGIIIRLSGELADYHWRSFRAMCDKCSRLDVAITGRCELASFNVASLSLREARAWKRQHDTRLNVGYHLSEPGGQTVEIGSRSSEKYGRIYDKYAESGAPWQPGTWRWELEAKGEYAEAISNHAFGEPDRRDFYARVALGYFAERGVSLPCKIDKSQWRYVRVLEKLTVERKLQYLERSIKPLVREVALAVGEKTVLDCLGLWPDNQLGQYEQLSLEGDNSEPGSEQPGTRIDQDVRV